VQRIVTPLLTGYIEDECLSITMKAVYGLAPTDTGDPACPLKRGTQVEEKDKCLDWDSRPYSTPNATRIGRETDCNAYNRASSSSYIFQREIQYCKESISLCVTLHENVFSSNTWMVITTGKVYGFNSPLGLQMSGSTLKSVVGGNIYLQLQNMYFVTTE
jgi:hypothetical protein